MTDNQLHEPDTCRNDKPAPDLFLSPATAAHLRRGAVWARFMAVVGFIGCGVCLLAAIALFAFGGLLTAYVYPLVSFAPMLLAVIYLAIAVIGFFLNLFLYRFADRSIRAADTYDSESLATGVRNLTNYLLATGIIVLLSLAIPAVATIVVLII